MKWDCRQVRQTWVLILILQAAELQKLKKGKGESSPGRRGLFEDRIEQKREGQELSLRFYLYCLVYPGANLAATSACWLEEGIWEKEGVGTLWSLDSRIKGRTAEKTEFRKETPDL